ncbi:MAG: hypothetical protein CBC48_00450 [bacterium TMED88]|nr:MAG: hypothetical protein CBC48_00450 [bacterium TMED88]
MVTILKRLNQIKKALLNFPPQNRRKLSKRIKDHEKQLHSYYLKRAILLNWIQMKMMMKFLSVMKIMK